MYLKYSCWIQFTAPSKEKKIQTQALDIRPNLHESLHSGEEYTIHPVDPGPLSIESKRGLIHRFFRVGSFWLAVTSLLTHRQSGLMCSGILRVKFELTHLQLSWTWIEPMSQPICVNCTFFAITPVEKSYSAPRTLESRMHSS